MKLILQIALGVFIGATASQLLTDVWRDYRHGQAQQEEERLRAEQARIRQQQGERIRALLLQGRKQRTADSISPPEGYVPDDAGRP